MAVLLFAALSPLALVVSDARVASGPLQAEKPGQRPSRADAVAQLVREGLTRGQAYTQLQELCKDMPHRLSGSADAENAESWAERRMKANGFANVHREVCRVPHWVRGTHATLAVATPATAAETRLPILALGGSVATPKGGVRGGLVVVKSFDELHELGAKVAGKIVLFAAPMDPAEIDPFEAYGKAVGQRSQGAIEAAKLGAVAAIVRSMTLRLDDLPHTGAMRYDDAVTKIPAAAISTAGAERLEDLVRNGAIPELVLDMDCRDLGEVEAHNVVGDLVGSEFRNEVVLVGGHLDNWDIGEGAHDDGAGSAEALEAVRLIRAAGLTPRRTVRCILWMNEENGLRGAFAYHDAHVGELEHHVLAIETDRGGFSPRGFGTNATGAAWDEISAIAEILAPYGAGMLRHGSGGADTIPLERSGVNVMEFLPDASRYFDVHHCAADTLDSVHPRELQLSAAVIAGMVYCVADLDHPLSRPAPKATEPAAAQPK